MGDFTGLAFLTNPTPPPQLIPMVTITSAPPSSTDNKKLLISLSQILLNKMAPRSSGATERSLPDLVRRGRQHALDDASEDARGGASRRDPGGAQFSLI